MMDWRDDHPAGVISTRSKLWFGDEVEGRYLGAFTAFIAAPLTDEEFERVLHPPARLQQVFFTETFDSYDWIESRLPALYDARVLITVARMPTQVDAFLDWRERTGARVELIARFFSAPWIHRMTRLHDQVSIGVPYHMRTYTVPQGTLTVPTQYQKDVR